MKPCVIYHANCADGFGAAFAAWLVLGDDADYVPMQYGHAPIDSMVGKDREVYILDFSLPKPQMDHLFSVAKRVVWLDHHKTAFEMWCDGKDVPVEHEYYCCAADPEIILDNSRSGALLAWEYFHPGTEVPMLIRHIDDRDRWQFKIPGSRELNSAIWSHA